ncbi:hypothetical protein [Acinetobacter pragensis]|uniref:hypothetical protein n=1 Tax=Acinetobacter pragensis TaxID=1806892 RepID=UPI003342CB7A
MTTDHLSSALEDTIQPDAADTSAQHAAAPKKASKFSPTVKGVLIGAVAGSVLPVFGTFSGALIGGIAGKIYQKKCIKAL